MSGMLLGLASHLIGPISGTLTTPVMDWLDDEVKLTAKWPDWLKRLTVGALAGILPVVASLTGLNLSSDPSDLLSKPEIQMLIAYALALFFKHSPSKSSVSPPPAAKPPT